MKEFFTRERANEGVELPLTLPEGGATEHWLRIRSIDSDAFRIAETEAKRRVLESALEKDLVKREEMIHDEELKCIGSLVCGWSFEQELTDAGVFDFLKEAPQIADAVNRFAAMRGTFYRKKSKSSTTGSK